jgi:hypothetical protein
MRPGSNTWILENEITFYLDSSVRPFPKTTQPGARLNNCHNASAFLKVPVANGPWPINIGLVKGSLAEKSIVQTDSVFWSCARSESTETRTLQDITIPFCSYKCFGIIYCLLLQGNKWRLPYLQLRTYVPVTERIITWIFAIKISNLLYLLLKEYLKSRILAYNT